jgi:hypothetical protein
MSNNYNMISQAEGTVEKVVLECKSLSERSGDPALRGFCGF